jgi:hypothetical protein
MAKKLVSLFDWSETKSKSISIVPQKSKSIALVQV